MPSYNKRAEKKYLKGACQKEKPLKINKLMAAREERAKEKIVKEENMLAFAIEMEQ